MGGRGTVINQNKNFLEFFLSIKTIKQFLHVGDRSLQRCVKTAVVNTTAS